MEITPPSTAPGHPLGKRVLQTLSLLKWVTLVNPAKKKSGDRQKVRLGLVIQTAGSAVADLRVH